jgi:hypothetical protein
MRNQKIQEAHSSQVVPAVHAPPFRCFAARTESDAVEFPGHFGAQIRQL